MSMHVVLRCGITQSIRDTGIAHLIELLEFVRTEWNRFENSKSRTMRNLTVPSGITHIVIGGELYKLTDRRALWFERCETCEKCRKGYNPNRFYISEVTDLSGHSFQLYLDRSAGSSHDDVRVVRAKLLYIPQQITRDTASTGPRVRD